MRKHVLIVACWIAVLATGVQLRFDSLSKRPLHADEATGARITATRMESGGGQFDPKHYHGPLLADLAIPLCKLNGESSWQEMTSSTLRTLPAIAGCLLLLVPLLWRNRCGDGPMLLAAAFLASSPLLVYYSRMFIHESLLVLFGMLALFALASKPRWGIAGILVGLMFATKESFAISIMAWSAAGGMLVLENRRVFKRETFLAGWRQYRVSIAASLFAAIATAGFIYTDGFRHPQGAVDAVRTFFVYETVNGHDKSIGYYFQLLALPERSGGVWWFGAPVLLLALFSYVSTFSRHGTRCRNTIRFLSYAAVGHFLIYSLIAYKTPWLACLPWAHVCLLAGFGVTHIAHFRPPLKFAIYLLVAVAIVSQFIQSHRAIDRFSSDVRNPFAYVPTRADIETLDPWLQQVQQAMPDVSLEPIAVIGADYWPLPWYLRSFKQVGYWPSPVVDLVKLPLVFAMPETAEAVTQTLASSHVSLPRGLRAGVPVLLFVRNDLWNRWIHTDSR